MKLPVPGEVYWRAYQEECRSYVERSELLAKESGGPYDTLLTHLERWAMVKGNPAMVQTKWRCYAYDYEGALVSLQPDGTWAPIAPSDIQP